MLDEPVNWNNLGRALGPRLGMTAVAGGNDAALMPMTQARALKERLFSEGNERGGGQCERKMQSVRDNDRLSSKEAVLVLFGHHSPRPVDRFPMLAK